MMSLSARAGRPKFLTGVRNESTLSGTSGANTGAGLVGLRNANKICTVTAITSIITSIRFEILKDLHLLSRILTNANLHVAG